MPIQQTSLAAYRGIEQELGDRQAEVLIALATIEPANNRMIAEQLHLPINSITPRTLELRKKGMVEEGEHLIDPKTHRKTIMWRIRK